MESWNSDQVLWLIDTQEIVEIVVVFDSTVIVRTELGIYKLVDHCDVAPIGDTGYDVPRNNILSLNWSKNSCQRNKNGNVTQKKLPKKK
jgi:hypothetical protein